MKSKQSTQIISKQSPMLVIGLGSIGARHYNNLVLLGYTNVHVYDIDKAKRSKFASRAIEAINEKTLKQFTAVFICNPSHLHVSTALIAAKAGCHIFIEKPLALSGKGLPALAAAIKENGVTTMVACNYRFHSGFTTLSEKLKKEIFGKPLYGEVAIGYDLRTARAGVDYRKTYAVSRASGGGVLFDSGAHVVDYLTALFGSVVAVAANTKTLVLPISAEDFATATLEFESGVYCNIVLDYFSHPRRNYLEVQCERGRFRFDVAANSFSSIDVKGKVATKQFSDGKGATNMFVEEIKYFMQVINKKRPAVSDIAHARAVSLILETLITSDKKKKRIALSKKNYS